MIITETKIPDVTKHSVEESKVVLANNIIKNIYPLFDEVYQSKASHIGTLKK